MGFQVKRVDKNQPEIVKAIRATGASVSHTHSLGHGFPDIVVGVDGLTLVGNFNKNQVRDLLKNVKGLHIEAGANLLVEIKDGAQPKSKKKLTPDEAKWHMEWLGQISVVDSVRAALLMISGSKKIYEKYCLLAGIESESEKINWDS